MAAKPSPLSFAHERVSMNVFPITPLLDEIGASLAAHPRLVLEAPPGASRPASCR